MNRLASIILGLLLLSLASTSFGVEVTMLGEKQYIRTNKAPDHYTDSFTAYAKPGLVIILNGDDQEENRVSSASILLNGKQIFSPSDFNQQTSRLETRVDLSANNTLETKLTSKPGSFLRVKVLQDVEPPTATIKATPEIISLGAASTLFWSSTNGDSVTIEPSIGGVTENGSTAVSPTETTTYTITATNRGGAAIATAVVKVIYPPSITIIEPKDPEEKTDTSYTIQWDDSDRDDNASISLYYDTDNQYADGTLIVSGLQEDLDGETDDQYVWDTSKAADGTYSIYAVIDDGTHEPVIAYSPGTVTVQHATGAIPLTPDDTTTEIGFGGSVSKSGEYAVIGAPKDDVSGISSGSTYVFKRDGDTWVQHTKLTPSDRSAYDSFGCSVAISGDYIIVGASGDDDGGESSGSAYIFKREGDTWTEQAKITASHPAAYSHFAKSIDMDGDYAVIGAYGDDTGDKNAGAAYVFKRNGDEWVQQAILVADDAAAEDFFGWSVSISGDSVLVGAWGDDDKGKCSGSAYVFKREGEIWTKEAKLVADDGDAYDYFGWSVSISGNYTLVGACGDDDNGIDAGAAYLFSHNSPWAFRVKITPDELAQSYLSRNFGKLVYIDYTDDGIFLCISAAGSDQNSSGDYLYQGDFLTDLSNDGYNTPYLDWTWWLTPHPGRIDSIGGDGDDVVVGSSGEGSDEGGNTDTVVVYPRSKADISAAPENILLGQSSTLSWTTENASRVSIDQGIGTISKNGSRTVSPKATTTYAITATGPGGTATDRITVNVIDPSAPPTVTLTASADIIYSGGSTTLTWKSTNATSCVIEPGVGDVTVNSSVRVSPTKTTTYTVTATGPKSTTSAKVTVTVLPAPADSIQEVAKLTAHDTNREDFFGKSIAIDSDYMIIGSMDYVRYKWSNIYNSGAAYIFKREGSNWVEQEKLTAPDAESNDCFGDSVAISGDYAIIGAQYKKGAKYIYNSGAAYIFKRQGSSWVKQAKLVADRVSAHDHFGRSVAISDDYAVVTSDDGGGEVYIFKRESSSWIEQVKLIAHDNDSYFGESIAISGDYLLVSANNYDDGENYLGVVYIYKREGSNWVEQLKLIAHDTARYDSFGESIAIDGDYTVISDPNDDNCRDNCRGAAYIFKREGSNWVEQTKLFASADEYLGPSIAINGDYLVIGSSYNPGLAYIFKRNGGAWIKQAKLTGHDAAYDSFGKTVAINGNYAVIGAPQDKGSWGAVYVYSLAPSPPTLTLEASPTIINVGESATLTWSSDGVDELTIDQGIGPVAFNGSVTVTPEKTTIYTISGKSAGEQIIKHVTVNVIDPSKPPTVEIASNPSSIFKGDAVTLTWHSTDATSCVIAPAVGTVGPQGSAEVSPTATTTYTITATGPSGTTTASVTVEVSEPTIPPAITLTAQPENITFGQPATLQWSSRYADFCTIEPGIGAVSINGSIKVSPSATTTYTLTSSSGPGGTSTATASVHVTYPPPIVTFTATPETILPDKSATLSWSVTGSTSVSITPDIGSVATTGTIQVSPAEETTYTITASGLGGEATANVTVTIASLQLEITSPVEGETIYRSDILVTGTVQGAEEIGILVNGVRALVNENLFAANHVPLQEGKNVITVEAVDSEGHTATKSIIVIAAPTARSVSLHADTESGLPPLVVELDTRANFTLSGNAAYSHALLSGAPSGPVQYSQADSPEDRRVIIVDPGLYIFMVEAKDDLGELHTDSVAVLTTGQAYLDDLLKATWNNMKAAMIADDVEKAVSYFTEGQQETFRDIYTKALPQLPQIAAEMQEIEMIYQKNDTAEYRLKKDIVWKGNPTTVTFYVYFQKDSDGIWRIRDY